MAVTTIRLQADKYFALADELPRFSEPHTPRGDVPHIDVPPDVAELFDR